MARPLLPSAAKCYLNRLYVFQNKLAQKNVLEFSGYRFFKSYKCIYGLVWCGQDKDAHQNDGVDFVNSLSSM